MQVGKKEIYEVQTYWIEPENSWEFDEEQAQTYSNAVYLEQCKRRGKEIDDSGFVIPKKVQENEEMEKSLEDEEDLDISDFEDDDWDDDSDFDDLDEDLPEEGIVSFKKPTINLDAKEEQPEEIKEIPVKKTLKVNIPQKQKLKFNIKKNNRG